MREPEGRLLEMSWDGFDESLRRELDWFWRDQRTLTDVTLFCDGGSIRAHKLVLALCSPYFLNMCIETQAGCNNSVISLRGVDLNEFKLLLEFMYRGHVLVEEAKVEHVVKLARALHVRGFGSEREVRKKRDRNGSVGSVFADSDGDEENDENTQRRKVYIRPEEIALDDMPPNRVTRASLANQEVARSSRRLSESRGLSPDKKQATVKDQQSCPKRPPLIASKSPEKTGNTSQDSKAAKISPRKLREKSPTAENEAPKEVGPARKDSKHACRRCDFTATTATLLATHLVQKHHPISPRATDSLQNERQGPEKLKEPKDEASSLVCEICGFSAGNAGALGNHRNRHKQPEAGHSSVVSPPSGPTASGQSPLKSPLVTDVSMQIAGSEHFKLIYDCPRCIKISFKTPNIMTRHLMKRHHGEQVQPVTRVNCGHCEHAFAAGERVDDLVAHLKQSHGIDANEVRQVMPVKIKDEPVDREETPLAASRISGRVETNCASNCNGPSGHDGPGAARIPASDPPIDTASNADTERASSRESFVLSPTPNRASIVSKRSRLSHDEEATIETPEVSPSKGLQQRSSASPTSAATSLTLNATVGLLQIKREVDDLVPEGNGVFHKCPECNYHTSQEHFLKRHMIACHSNGKTEEPFLCKYCNFSTGHRSTIKSHLVMVHRDSTTKVRDCFRNAAEISRLEQALTRDDARKRPVPKTTDRAASTSRSVSGSPPDAKQTRKRKTFPGSEASPSAGSSPEVKTPPVAVSPATRAKRIRKVRTIASPTPSPPLKAAGPKLKNPASKSSQNLHKFEAALKLKKAALAKQRRRSDTAKIVVPRSSAAGNAIDGKSRRSRSRLSAPALQNTAEISSPTTTKKSASTGSLRTPTSAAASSSGRDASVETKSEVRKDRTKEKDTKERKCPDCTYVAKGQVMFDKHVTLHTSYDETKLALCEVCGVVMLKVSMGYHLKKHEGRDSGQSTSAGKSV